MPWPAWITTVGIVMSAATPLVSTATRRPLTHGGGSAQ